MDQVISNPKLIPEDYWVKRTDSPLVVLSESHHLLMMYMQFVTFFSQELLKPEVSSSQRSQDAKDLLAYTEAVNSVIKAVDNFMNRVRSEYIKTLSD
ncbi:MAG: hypothetical protein HY865_10875 [Chloroflexi bacterium]|nr:hypothetical protein [Chloroflexota bacterium]